MTESSQCLRENESTLSSIFRAAPIGIGLVCNRVVVRANNRFCEIVGYSPEELIGKSARMLYLTDEDFEYVGREKYRQIKKKGTGTVETQLRHKDGKIIDVLLSSTPLDLNDLSAGVTFTVLDITSRKQVEKALYEANKIINRSPVVAFLWENKEDWPVQFVSENVENILEYSVQEFVEGKILYSEIIHRDDLERVVEEVACNSTTKGPHSFPHEPYRIISKNGEIKWVHDTTYIRRDARGEISHYEGIIYDITGQRLQQERIAHLSLLRQTMLAVHRHLATIPDKQLLLQAICDVFVNEQGYRSAWIVLLDERQRYTLTASSGLLLDFRLLKQEMDQGTPPPCLREAMEKRQFFRQTSQQPFCAGCPLTNGYPDAGFMVSPLHYGKRIYGVLTVSQSADVVSDSGEQELLEEMSRDIAFAFFNREQDAKRQQHQQEISFRDRISRAFILHRDDKLYGEVLSIALETMESKLGVFGYLEGPDTLICPSMTTTVWKQCRMENKTITFPRKTWVGIWKEALETGTTQYANTPFAVPAGHLAIDNSMATAIVFAGKVIGLLQVANKEKGYNEQDKRLLESLATTIAPILKARLEQQRTEHELLHSLAEYADLYNNSPDMFASVEAGSGRVLQCNQTLLDTLGYDRDEVIGQPVFALYHPDCLQECRNDVFPTFCKTGIINNRELKLQCKDGSVLPVTLDASAVRDQDNNIIQSRSIWHDITDRKRLEEQLIISEKMTTIASLAAGVAHEINTPLSGILQSIQLVEMGLDPGREQNQKLAADCGIELAKVKDYLQKKELDFFLQGIRNSATTAAHIIADLLQFSRPNVTERISVPLTELIDRSIELAKTDYALKKEYNILNVQFIREYSPDLPAVNCMAMEIEQVLINLIKNSCQAMAADGGLVNNPHIILRAKQREQMAVIEVEDNGPGMEEKIYRQIFDPFFTTREAGKGTGLGLSVCYSIICNKHGGNLRIQSEPGKGTRFIIELPTS